MDKFRQTDAIKKMKRMLFAALCISAVLCTAGCGVQDPLAGSDVAVARQDMRIYYIDETAGELKNFPFEPESTDADEMIQEFLEVCAQPSAGDGTLIPLLSDPVQVLDFQLEDDVLKLNLSADYAKLRTVQELLVRAGLVKTLTQIDGVNYIDFMVNGKPLEDRSGTALGKQGRDNYVEDASRSINSYKKAVMTLYYTDQSGTRLVPEERNVYYNSSEPVERAVVEEIVRGPASEGHYPAVSSEIKVLSVTVQEGVCYVNLDEVFNNSVINVQADVQIYSIVNALVDTCHVSRVQFSINGESSGVFRDTLELDKMYEKNEELIASEK